MSTALGIVLGFLSVWAWCLAKIAEKEAPTLTRRELNDYELRQKWHARPL